MENINKNKDHNLYEVEMRKLDNRDQNKASLKAFYKENKGKIIGLFLSLLTVISLLNFGFFRTLGIWIVMAAGYLIGAYFDRDVRVLRLIRSVLN